MGYESLKGQRSSLICLIGNITFLIITCHAKMQPCSNKKKETDYMAILSVMKFKYLKGQKVSYTPPKNGLIDKNE